MIGEDGGCDHIASHILPEAITIRQFNFIVCQYQVTNYFISDGPATLVTQKILGTSILLVNFNQLTSEPLCTI